LGIWSCSVGKDLVNPLVAFQWWCLKKKEKEEKKKKPHQKNPILS